MKHLLRRSVKMLSFKNLPLMVLLGLCGSGMQAEEERFRVEGRAIVPGVRAEQWSPSAHVQLLLSTEQHVAFIRLDGSFTIYDVAPGSYVVQIIHPTYRFDPVRVDLTTTGKIRARRVSYLKPSEVLLVPYPLQMKCTGYHSYFIKRDTWTWSDFLMNPMVLMMLLPLVILLLLPKLINLNDPGVRRDMEQSMNAFNPNPELPDMSELMTKFFTTPKSPAKPRGTAHRGHRGGDPRRR